VYLRPGGGDVLVNRKTFAQYFPNEALRMIIRQPLQLTDTTKFDVVVNAAVVALRGKRARSGMELPAL
jgi:small subunit ribosomal protein S9